MPLFGPPNVRKMRANGNVKGLIRALSFGLELEKRWTAMTDKDRIAWRRLRDRVRIDAAEALKDFGDARASEPLISLFREDRDEFGIPAVEALAKIGPPAIPPLTGALRDENPVVRHWAVMALGGIGGDGIIGPLAAALRDSSPQVYLKAVKELEKIGAAAVEPLAGALKSPAALIPERAAEALGRIGDARAFEPLAMALRDVSNFLRPNFIKAVAQALGQIGGPRAVEPLVACLKDNPKLRNMGVPEALTKIGAPAVRPLAAALVEMDESLFWASAEALGKIGQPALEPLLETLRDPRPHLRKAAIHGLGFISGADLTAHLVSSLRDREREVRKEALDVLRKTGWQPSDDVERAVSWIIERDALRLSDLDIPAITELLVESFDWAADADDWAVKGHIAKLLARPETHVEDSIRRRAAGERKAYAKRCDDEIERMVRERTPYEKEPDPANAHDRVFGDYGILMTAAFGYSRTGGGYGEQRFYQNDTVACLRAVERLCRIVTPVSTNLLHHVRRLGDLSVVVQVGEVEYSREHPSGYASRSEPLSFEAPRRAAADELVRRGNPPYDPAAYMAEGCWRIPAG